MSSIEIKRVNSKWLVNGKQYAYLSEKEKTYFDGFLNFMKQNFKNK